VAEVVAEQVHDHDVLCTVLERGFKAAPQRLVDRGIVGPAPGALDRLGPHAAVGGDPQEALRRGTRDRQLAEPQVARERRRVAFAQREVAFPRVQPGIRRRHFGGEADFVRVAFGNLVLGLGDFAFVFVRSVAAGELKWQRGTPDGGIPC
jgi:hypothetical protein